MQKVINNPGKPLIIVKNFLKIKTIRKIAFIFPAKLNIIMNASDEFFKIFFKNFSTLDFGFKKC